MKNTRNVIVLIAVIAILAIIGFGWKSSIKKDQSLLINSEEIQNASSTGVSNSDLNGTGMQGKNTRPTSSYSNIKNKPSTGSDSVSTSSSSESDSLIFCTMDARMCPDGSAVGRTGPTCAFAACPGESPVGDIHSKTSTSLNQTVLISGVYVTPLRVVSDSRCPVDVTCVWAGEVKVLVHLEKKNVSKDIEVTLGKDVIFQDSTVSLTDVQPEQKSKASIYDKDYIFTFWVK